MKYYSGIFVSFLTIFVNVSSQVADPFCKNGLINSNICCTNTCVSCGGLNCSSNPVNCCSSNIISSARYCNVTSPPCIIVDVLPVPVRVPSTPDPTCSKGLIKHNICCNKGCRICGGSACSNDPLGADNCCLSTIANSTYMCADYSAPCVIGGSRTNSNNSTNSTTPQPGQATSAPTPTPTSGSFPNFSTNYVLYTSLIFISVMFIL